VTDDFKELLIPIVISVPFFIFGFAITAGLLDLSVREIAVGLFAGSVCGVTSLAITLYRSANEAEPELPTSA
jgi:hypothetical protein